MEIPDLEVFQNKIYRACNFYFKNYIFKAVCIKLTNTTNYLRNVVSVLGLLIFSKESMCENQRLITISFLPVFPDALFDMQQVESGKL